MKKKLLTIGMTSVMALAIGFGVYQFTSTSSAATLSLEEAKDIATTQFPGTVLECELERDGSKAVFEVKIEADGKLYELKIDGDSGEVLKLEEKEWKGSGEISGKSEQTDDGQKLEGSGEMSFETESPSPENSDQTDNQTDDQADDTDTQVTEDSNTDNHNSSNNNNNNADDSKNGDDNSDDNNEGGLGIDLSLDVSISQENAIQIARDEIQNASAVVKEIELEEDDGRFYYELEMVSGNQEFDMEIDAYSGAILSISSENEED